MQKILVNVPSQPAGRQAGVIRVCFSLLGALVERRRYEYALRTTYPREQLPSSLQAGSVEVITIPSSRRHFLSMVRDTVSVPPLAKKIGAAVILNIDQVGPMASGRPQVMIVHDVVHHALPDTRSFHVRWRTDLMFKLMTRASEGIVAISETTARDLTQLYPSAREKTVVIPLDTTLDVDGGLSSDPPRIEQPYILTVANGTPNKKLATIGLAMRLLDDRGISVRLVHVGKDAGDQISQAAGGKLKTAQILRVESVDDRMLAALYRHAICYVNTSVYEGFCLPVIEAQKLGCPVICSNLSATAEVAGKGAILCDPNDASALAANIERVLSDEALRDDLRVRGKRNAVRFSWSKSAEAFEALFDRLIAKTTE